jgi:predicted ATPase
MKVSRIEINDFQQFKDFELDLTYPEGHPKAGQPLDKVCFIGQSGTGKTTILDSIYNLMGEKSSYSQNKIKNIAISIDVSYNGKAFARYIMPKYTESQVKELEDTTGFQPMEIRDSFLGNITTFLDNNKDIIRDDDTHPISPNTPVKKFNELVKGEKHSRKLYFPAGLIFRAKELLNKNIQVAEELASKLPQDKLDEYLRQFKMKNFYHFGVNDFKEFWEFFLIKKLQYENEYNLFTYEITDLMLKKSFKEAQEKTKKLQEWADVHTNILEQYRDFINPIIEQFNLSVDTSFDYRSMKEINFIKLKDTKGNKFDVEEWSTGTKQMILNTFPIFILVDYLGIVLIDEPENSLFPDIQRTLIKTYRNLAPEAQFFFATHSPIIASQFEPWEIVELKFDENGNVYREKFYEGENKVENYTIFPQYLRWDSILTKVFDMEYNSNEARNGKLNELTALEVKLRKLKTQEGASKEEILALWAEYEKLANLLDWQIK